MTRTTRLLPRAALYTALASWAGLTIARQINYEYAFLGRVDRLGITVPNYRFFGPVPVSHDLHLMIRFHLGDGSAGPWQELVSREDRRLLHTLWAPHRRLDKGMFDALRELMALTRKFRDTERLAQTVPYRLLLNVAVFGVGHPPEARAVQFAIGRSAALDAEVTPEILLVSDVHGIETVRQPRSGVLTSLSADPR